MKSFIILLVIGTGFFLACKKSNYVSTTDSGDIKLHGCANSIFQADRVTLCFDSVLNDSRCPANGVCIWAGAAVCKFSLTLNNEVHPITLSTIDFAFFKKDTTLLGYKLEFINLSPYPGLPPVPAPGDEVRAEVKVTRL